MPTTALRHRLLVSSLLIGIGIVWAARSIVAQYPSGPQISKDGTVVLLQDYASLPLSSVTSGVYPPAINFASQLARVNFLRSEPAPSSSVRFFVSDSNRYLYILNRTTKAFTTYLNFEEMFPKFDNTPGLSAGLVTFAFAPDYAANGTFYTVHLEDPNRSGSAVPTNTSVPGLDLSAGGGYVTTSAINPPAGTVVRQAVLIEWKDTNNSDSTFQGTAREILRVGFAGNIHPLGDLIFNPAAQPGDPDYSNLYVAVGDGASGETAGATHTIPQRLDALPGKILRITPDINLRIADPLSANLRYRIPSTGPDPNPFVSLSLANVKTEIYAYGFRNPHRMNWDSASNVLIVNDIGLNSWEEVDVVTKGGNYGYAEREGPDQLFIGGANSGITGSQTNPPTPFPNPDTLIVTGLSAPVTPIYPAMAYTHQEGDAMSSGFVYRGSRIPQLYGTYIFGDITTGRVFYSDLTAMMASTRTSPAPIHEIQILYSSPYNSLGPLNRRLYDVVADGYAAKGGDSNPSSSLGVLPGRETVVGGFSGGIFTQGRLDIEGVRYGGGRADIRIVEGGDREIYILSKSDGMIRSVLSVSDAPPVPAVLPPTGLTVAAGNAQAVLTWSGVVGATAYSVKRATNNGGPYATVATNVAATTYTNTGLSNGTTYYYVVSALKGSTESVNSSQASGTPSAPPQGTGLPSPWQTRDIGAVAATGNATWANGVFTVTGSGEDIYGALDEFRYVYQLASGNCDITARMFAVQNTDPWAEAGVLIRETLNSNARKVAAHVTFSNGVTFQRRSSTGGQTYYTRTAGVSAPYWVRLVRSGDTFTSYRSANGTTWTSMGSVTVSMTTNVYIGLAVTAHRDGALNTSTIDKVTVTP